MKKSGKVLLGVLSVSALVGTGFAAWVVNNGIVSTASSIVTPTVDTDISYQHGTVVKLNLTEKDTDLKFAKDQDLTISYNLKATPADGLPTFNPYEEGIYESLSDDYVPDVKVTVTPVDKTSHEPLTGAALTAANSYVVAPAGQTIPYTTWLASTLSVTGYDLDLSFAWGEAVGSQNPQTYITSTYSTVEEQKTAFQAVIDALKDVVYKVDFTVGARATTGTINIAPTEHGTITVKDLSGNVIANGSTVRTGKTLKVETTPDAYYKDGTITVNGVESVDTFAVLEGSNTISATFTNKQAAYTVNAEHATVTVKQGETVLDSSAKLNAGSTFTVEATAAEGYENPVITVTQGESTLTAEEGVYTTLDSEETIEITVSTTLIPVTHYATFSVTPNSDVTYSLLKDGVATSETQYAVGTTLTLKDVIVTNEYKQLSRVTLNSTPLEAVDGVYTISLADETTYTLAFELVDLYTVNLVQGENTTLSASTSLGSVTSGTTKVTQGTVITITATADTGYTLEVSAKEGEGTPTTLTAGEGNTYTYTALGTGAITIESKATEVIDGLNTITSKTDGDSFTAIGKVLYKASDNKSILIADQSQGIGYVYTNTTSLISGLSLNDVVKVSGTISSYNNAKQISPSSIEVVENTIAPNYSVTEINTYEDYAPLTSTETCGYGVYKFNAVTLNDSYKNFQLLGIVDGESQPVTISNMYSSLEANKALTVTAAICGVKSSLPLAYVISTETYAVDPTLVEWNLSKTTIGVDEELTLATTATPVYSTYSVDYEITSGNEFATLENNVLKGTAAGTVTVTGTIKNAAGETILSALTKDIIISGEAPTTLEEEITATGLNLGGAYTSNGEGVTLSSNLGIKYDYLMKGSNSTIQTKNKSSQTSSLYNVTISNNKVIEKITIYINSSTNASSTLQVGFGSSEKPNLNTSITYTGTDYVASPLEINADTGAKFFSITRTGSGAMYIDKIVITFKA